MQPTVGAMVQYALTKADAEHIRQRRSLSFNTGNPVNEGTICAGIVTASFADGRVNLHVFLDGTDTHWVTDARECIPKPEDWLHPMPGTWDWPDRHRFSFAGDAAAP